MDFFQAVETRRSIRAYTDERVTSEQLLQVLEAARISPSWKNSQSCSFIVVSDRELMHKIGEATNFNPHISAYDKATYLLVLCAQGIKSGHHNGKDYYLVDSGIYMEHAVLAAQALGLATCWIGFFPEEKVKPLLGVPDDISIVAMTPLGYAGQTRKERQTKPLEQFAYTDQWENPLKI
jgi:nitroreductase